MDPIPTEMVAAVRDALAPLSDQIVEAVRAENRVYADVLEGPEGVGIRLGIEQAITSFLEAIERGERPAGTTAELWRRLGEAEFQAGRGLDALRAAWRTGTLAAWRGAARIASAAGVPAETVIALAEAIFVFTDELASDVVEGYLRMQSDEAGERERRRRRLAALLLDPDEHHDPEAIAHAAELAQWRVPEEVAVLAIAGEASGELRRRLHPDVLVGTGPDGTWLLIPDPEGPGRERALRGAVRGVTCALGPAVASAEAERSLRWARLTLSLVEQGALPSEHPTRSIDHLAIVIALQDRRLAGELVRTRLRALLALPEPERDRLLRTLAAWLAHQRHTPAIAEELHVHPQTVRYRIAKLRELLGDALTEPDRRFELELAVRALGAARGPCARRDRAVGSRATGIDLVRSEHGGGDQDTDQEPERRRDAARRARRRAGGEAARALAAGPPGSA